MRVLLMHPDRDFDGTQMLPRQSDTMAQDLELTTLWDAMAAYTTGPWRFSVNLSNLTDRQYRTQCNTFRGGAQFCALGFGREVRVAAAYRF